MKSPPTYLLGLVVALLVVAAIAPALVSLAKAVLPLVIVLTIAAVVLRLVIFHTRRW